MIYLDTETCGFHGAPVLIQYAQGNDDPTLYEIWKEKRTDTLALIEWMLTDEICAFNLAFDWYHLVKIYNILRFCKSEYPNQYECFSLQKLASDRAVSLKPKGALDLMLHARKGPYQSTMERSDICIRKVPNELAYKLRDELERRIPLKDIYFARYKNKVEKWSVFPREDDDQFKDIVLKFAPSSGLKALAIDALGLDPIKFQDIHCKQVPEEKGYSPMSSNWDDMIEYHIDHWRYNKKARQYAADDVTLLQQLHEYFEYPEAGDNDSELTICVANCRWKGYKIDVEMLKEAKAHCRETYLHTPMAPGAVKKYVHVLLSPEELLVADGTGKVILEEIATFCEEGEYEGSSEYDKEIPLGYKPTEVAMRAREVLAARKAKKQEELFDKLIEAGKFHASFKVGGALSGRMSGGDGLNPQGINRAKHIRSCFPLAPDGMDLEGGDFDSFELAIGLAIFDDELLNAAVSEGKKVHALFAMDLYDLTYEEAMEDKDIYNKGKSAVYLKMYFGNEYTLQDRLGIDEETAVKFEKESNKKYKGIKKYQESVYSDFCSMRQPNGLGTKVEWHEPKEYMETLLGFRRYFTLENMICKTLFQIAEDPPKEWLDLKVKVVRRDRVQTAGNSVRSALFGAAFGIQSSNLRAAGNHKIQGTGAGICKDLQRSIWDLQPEGVHEFVVMPMNIHDEVMCPKKENVDVTSVVEGVLDKYRPLIPLIKMDWGAIKSWADK